MTTIFARLSNVEVFFEALSTNFLGFMVPPIGTMPLVWNVG